MLDDISRWQFWFEQVQEAAALAKFVLEVQKERAAVSLAVFLDSRSGKTTDLTPSYASTDAYLQKIKWRKFGKEKIFENKLRFQIRIDDFRKRVTEMNKGGIINNDTIQVDDKEVLDFYNLATGKLLTALESDIGDAQNGKNWKLLMTYFNMIQTIESCGIGLVYGLR